MSDDQEDNRPAQTGVKLPMRPEFQLFFDHYLPPAKAVIFNAEQFFEEMQENYSLKDAAIFASVGLTTCGIMSQLIHLDIKAAPIAVIMTFFFAGVMSAIYFGLAKAQGGKGSLEETAKVVCYSSVTSLLAWIPLVQVIPIFFSMYLHVVGIKVVHQLTLKQASVAVLIPSFFFYGVMFVMQVMAWGKH